jgi:hypothetical protein
MNATAGLGRVRAAGAVAHLALIAVPIALAPTPGGGAFLALGILRFFGAPAATGACCD